MVSLPYAVFRSSPELHFLKISRANEPQGKRVIEVVGVVSQTVGRIDHLSLEQGLPAVGEFLNLCRFPPLAV